MRSSDFVDKYRAIESLLERKYSDRGSRHVSAVMEYLNDPESRPVRGELETAREIRNIIMHNADSDGLPVVEPSEATLATMGRIAEYIRKPPLALSFATPAEQMLCARANDQALPLMRAMLKRGFSHIPVLEGDSLAGVFSTATLFAYLAQRPDAPVGEDTRVSQFSEFLPLEAHEPEQFRFMDEHATYADVKLAFEQRRSRNHRLAAVFITDTGDPAKPLLGMITPWDALGKRGADISSQE